MRQIAKWMILPALAVAVSVGAGSLVASPKASPTATTALAALSFEPYEAQKVVYHVTESQGLFERKWKNLLHVARNHIDAVAFDELDLKVLLQGGGVDILSAARRDLALAREIDLLKARGVRFIVCRNTLVLKGIDPASLHGLRREDIVSSSVAEVVRLAGAGYVVLRF